jgi:hypothetical protein
MGTRAFYLVCVDVFNCVSTRFQLAHRETRTKVAIVRFVKPPARIAPKGAGAFSASGDRSIRVAGLARTVHLG